MSSSPAQIASNARRRAARLQTKADDEAPRVDRKAMALLRLSGVFDAMQRAGLTAPRLVALADRLVSGLDVASDCALLDALPALDLHAANLTPAAFIIERAAPLRVVVATFRQMGIGDSDLLIPPAVAQAGQFAGRALKRRLQTLPNAATLAWIGESLRRGAVDAGELALVRALPAVYLRGKAQHRHWQVFAQHRGG